MTTVVLVHGAWHGAWSWARLEPELEARGLAHRSLDLPSVGDASADLPADVAALRTVVESVDGPVVLVGHSYGGVVITQAGAELPQVERLVYVTAFAPDAGESLLDQVTYGPLTWIVPEGEGLLGVEHGRELDLFYGDLDPATAASAAARLRPQAAASFAQPVEAAGWRERPTTYVVCTEDRCIPPSSQREWSRRADDVAEIGAGHSPFLSQPGALADLLAVRVAPNG